MANKTIPSVIDPVDLGPALHTALRKCCDSTESSLAWNLVELMPRPVWIKFIGLVGAAYAAQSDEKKSWLAAAKEGSRTLEREWGYSVQWKKHEHVHWCRCLYLTLNLFSENDWVGFVSFLEEEEEEEDKHEEPKQGG